MRRGVKSSRFNSISADFRATMMEKSMISQFVEFLGNAFRNWIYGKGYRLLEAIDKIRLFHHSIAVNYSLFCSDHSSFFSYLIAYPEIFLQIGKNLMSYLLETLEMAQICLFLPSYLPIWSRV